MKNRCENPNDRMYEYYGQKGIECRFDSTDDFVDYILSKRPLKTYIGYELHRTDNGGHYERGNVEMLTIADHHDRHVQMRADEIPF